MRYVLLAAVAALVPAQALGFGQVRPVRELTTSLSSDDATARARAACDLKEHGGNAVDAMDALVHLLADATPVDATVCRERWADDPARQTTPGQLAAAALVAVGSRSVPPLLAVLEQPQWVARRNATWALGALDDERAVAPVTAVLQDREAPVRQQAAWALGAMDAESAVQALVAVLKDPDEGVRRQAAWALGAIGDSRATAGLIGALKDPESGVRRQAAWALGAIGR